ncbi:MAG: DUF1028 domain-containing protein [Anaerolineales bacterium]
MKPGSHQLYSTYSIVARDPETGQFGVAVQTHQMTVGNFVPWLLAGVGALATQALGNIRFGPMGLAMLRQGIPAQRVVDGLVATDSGANHRQLAVVDGEGRAAAWTGEDCIEYAGHKTGDGFSVQANMMTHKTVIEAMVEAYQGAEGGLAQRMMAALEAAQAEDGDIRGKQSAALRVVRGEAPIFRDPAEWRPVYDLRVDEHESPVQELARLVRLRRAQLLDQEGHSALEEEDRARAMKLWAEARLLAPELEEITYWQALTLADVPEEVDHAVEILAPMLEEDPRRGHWVDLIRRVDRAGMFEREGAAEELIAALEAGQG